MPRLNFTTMRLRRSSLRWILPLLLIVASVKPASAQGVFPFTSGPIPMCDTSTFTANVSGIGYLIDPYNSGWGGSFLENLLVNITSNHPQTLQFSLTSPTGTTLLLSAFNGAGGQNYTNTEFSRWAYNSITTGSAPFTGQFMPQGGALDAFDGELADGTWVITVIDTSCANGGTGPGGDWTLGWFDGVGSGAFAFGFDSGSPGSYDIDLGSQTAVLCPGGSVDIMTFFQNDYPFYNFTAYEGWSGNIVTDPYAVTQAGEYSIEHSDMDGMGNFVYLHGIFTVIDGSSFDLGPDQLVDQCGTGTPVALPDLFDLTGLDVSWTLNGQSITDTEAANATLCECNLAGRLYSVGRREHRLPEHRFCYVEH